jgi:hypothetical protein
MKVKFISTSNSAFDELVGKEGTLGIDMVASFKFDAEAEDVSFDFRHGYMRTSQIENIKYDEISRFCYNIIIKTRNSVYIFQEGTKTDTPPLTKEEILAYQIAYGLF